MTWYCNFEIMLNYGGIVLIHLELMEPVPASNCRQHFWKTRIDGQKWFGYHHHDHIMGGIKMYKPSQMVPSGEHTKSNWKWHSRNSNFPIKNGGSFHSKILVHQRVGSVLSLPVYHPAFDGCTARCWSRSRISVGPSLNSVVTSEALVSP